MAYNPSDHIPLSKALGANAFPAEGKYMYFTNGVNGVYAYRAFVDTAEVKAYFPSGFRQTVQGTPLAFEILVNTGGTLSLDGSVITGGTNSIWWWRDGVLDADLIEKYAPVPNPKSGTADSNGQIDLSAETNIPSFPKFVVYPTAGGDNVPATWNTATKIMSGLNPSTAYTIKFMS